jgi:UDP-2-acetamido-3-amino-2,3-dideoxy-glucuronate N-acetyltransferase
MTIRIHPTAIVESGVEIGEGTSVWDNVHIRGPSQIGRDCIIGEKTYIAYGVDIADLVKINAMVYVCTAVTIERGVMISAGTIFTNDRFPRAASNDLSQPRSSAPDETTLATRVREGATIGAGCLIGCGFDIGRFAMVGMGSVVTRAVPAFHLVVGNPARSVGYVCRCGLPLLRFKGETPDMDEMSCVSCALLYRAVAGEVVEVGQAEPARRSLIETMADGS